MFICEFKKNPLFRPMFFERIPSFFPIPWEKVKTLIYEGIEGNELCYL